MIISKVIIIHMNVLLFWNFCLRVEVNVVVFVMPVSVSVCMRIRFLIVFYRATKTF